jgi:hypothetical protein
MYILCFMYYICKSIYGKKEKSCGHKRVEERTNKYNIKNEKYFLYLMFMTEIYLVHKYASVSLRFI